MEEDDTENDVLATHNMLPKLNEITSKLNEISNRIQSDCIINKKNTKKCDSFIDAKEYKENVKDIETNEESTFPNYPAIDYVNLHQHLSSLLISLCPPKVYLH